MGVDQFMVNWLWLSLGPRSENRWSSVFSILQSVRLSAEVMRSHMNAYMSTNAVDALTHSHWCTKLHYRINYIICTDDHLDN